MTEYQVKIKWPKGIFGKYTMVVEPKIKSDREFLDFVRQNEAQDASTGVPYRYQTYVNGKALNKAEFTQVLNRAQRIARSVA